ncbi:MAC/Perforin domain-containing protein [Pseudomonas asplenii]|uniref:MAC/Perforin domain-containing protein n=1 Tax=Pseudomonas asplenii TaxID=53407 RepID=A0A1H1TR03_9PSED|nr:MAC/perforin domain-containing protein [Pseudomonas asplenii]SDS62009.1 MAC/Perforin domain-containing protein [Pseudomonas asplenii]
MNNELTAIGGSQLLGLGLNKLDWASESRKCQKVGDTEIGKHPITCQGRSYNMGQHVTLDLVTREDSLIESFSSPEEYEQHTLSNLETKGSYGAFSAGFKATFGSDISQLQDHEVALYSHTVRLWKLSLAVTPDNATEVFKSRVNELPEAFDPTNAKTFFDFFVDFGADIVKEVVVGGSLNYAMTAAKSYLSAKASLKAMVEAEYEAFVSATASTSVTERVKRHIANRQSRLTTWGGTHAINFSSTTPQNYQPEFALWRQSLPDSPEVVELKLTPVYGFVQEGPARTALEAAYQWYTGYKAEIDATWASSVMVLGRDSRRSSFNAAVNGPALRTVFIDNKSKQTNESYHYPPAGDATPKAFEQFWDAMALLLNAKSEHKLLLTTERWPRDKRYCPNITMREALLNHGASDNSLTRWDSLTRNMQPNPESGLTYALAGNNLEGTGVDGVIAGFGQPGQNLKPRVKISARLCHDSFGRVKMVQTAKVLEDTQTILYLIRNNTGDNPALTADPQNKSRLALQKPDARYSGQLWYMPELEPHPDLNHPTLLINYETGTLLQGMQDLSDSRLHPIKPGPLEADVIWDRRGDDIFHLLMAQQHKTGLCLTQVEKRATVRRWREPHGMDWFRVQQQPQR